jgi:predicted RNA-binding Zn ribbon-like protein
LKNNRRSAYNDYGMLDQDPLIGQKPAPGRLSVIQSFLNTANVRTGRDDIADPDRLREWFVKRGLLAGRSRLTQADARQARAVRDALYRLLMAGQSAEQRAEAADTLNRSARSAQMAVSFDAGGHARIEPLAPAVDGALGKLIAIVVDAMADGTWERLKICSGSDCSWAFYDRSKNRSGTWCDITDCGNVAKARAYRARHARRTRT